MTEKRGFRRYLRQLLLMDEPPERTAQTFGFGVLVGFSPFIGFHTLIAIAVILLVRVNRLAFLAGVYSNTPWTVAPAAALGTALGVFIIGSDAALPEISYETLSSGRFWSELTADAWNLLVPFFIGNFILSAAFAMMAYWILKRFLLQYRARRGRRNVITAANGAAPSLPNE